LDPAPLIRAAHPDLAAVDRLVPVAAVRSDPAAGPVVFRVGEDLAVDLAEEVPAVAAAADLSPR